MSRFEVLILGNSSALSAFGRHPSGQLINIHEHILLIDCGEGTQDRLAQYYGKAHKIEHIFISHLHGDHYFGLPGLLTSMNLTGRKHPLHIYSPPGLEKLLEHINRVANSMMQFTIHWHVLKGNELLTIVDDSMKKISAFPLSHRIPTYGFIIQEKPGKRVFLVEKPATDFFNFEIIKKLKEGENAVLPDGNTIYFQDYTAEPLPTKAYVYCSDTIYERAVIPYILHADLLYHEATYADDFKQKAKENFHSTAKEAAQIALEAQVKKLMIGHFSSRYKSLDLFLTEAKTIFENTILALEGEWIKV